MTISFVHTPKCQNCLPQPCYAKRSSCVGCIDLQEKLYKMQIVKVVKTREQVELFKQSKASKYEDVVKLYLQGITNKEIADSLNCKMDCVYKNIQKYKEVSVTYE